MSIYSRLDKLAYIDLLWLTHYTFSESKSHMDLKKAGEWQRRLSAKLVLSWKGDEVRRVAGVDFSYDREKWNIGACIVVLEMPDLEIIEVTEAVKKVRVPYIPGYLAFREAPAFFEAFHKIRNIPDVTLVDGNGIAHPRKMGLASFVGVIRNICTIGCAKTAFFPFIPPGEQRGDMTDISNKRNERVGICLRTRKGVKPVFVSPGNNIDFKESVGIILRCSKFRIPEPLRKAHTLANQIF